MGNLTSWLYAKHSDRTWLTICPVQSNLTWPALINNVFNLEYSINNPPFSSLMKQLREDLRKTFSGSIHNYRTPRPNFHTLTHLAAGRLDQVPRWKQKLSRQYEVGHTVGDTTSLGGSSSPGTLWHINIYFKTCIAPVLHTFLIRSSFPWCPCWDPLPHRYQLFSAALPKDARVGWSVYILYEHLIIIMKYPLNLKQSTQIT